jgi:hypothetical protein
MEDFISLMEYAHNQGHDVALTVKNKKPELTITLRKFNDDESAELKIVRGDSENIFVLSAVWTGFWSTYNGIVKSPRGGHIDDFFYDCQFVKRNLSAYEVEILYHNLKVTICHAVQTAKELEVIRENSGGQECTSGIRMPKLNQTFIGTVANFATDNHIKLNLWYRNKKPIVDLVFPSIECLTPYIRIEATTKGIRLNANYRGDFIEQPIKMFFDDLTETKEYKDLGIRDSLNVDEAELENTLDWIIKKVSTLKSNGQNIFVA